MKKLLVVTASIVLLATACNKQVSVQPAQNQPVTAEVANWKTYTNTKYGFEFKYPEKLSLKEDRYTVVLSHEIPYKNNGDCDMTGGNKTYNDLTDFSLLFEIDDGNLQPKVADDQYKNGVLNGSSSYMGAEGCGEIEYYFPFGNNRTLIIRRAAVQATSGISTGWNLKSILSVPGAISKEESKSLFDQILSTFKFTK